LTIHGEEGREKLPLLGGFSVGRNVPRGFGPLASSAGGNIQMQSKLVTIVNGEVEEQIRLFSFDGGRTGLSNKRHLQLLEQKA
jgi:hypothetical protein